MTSRLDAVQNPYPLRRLTEEESLKFLHTMVFGGELCPPELQGLAKQIANSCKGIPLFIVTIAGLLVKADKRTWQAAAESLRTSTSLIDEGKRLKDFLELSYMELSYKHLPDHLKECFLYSGLYPEDSDISVRKLLWLWIAEGFIPKEEFKSLEDLAEGCLKELIDRSLVMVSKKGSNGKVKRCRVHDLLLDLCLLKAKDAHFLQLISAKPSYSSLQDEILSEDFNPTNFINSEQYRLLIGGDPEPFIKTRPSSPYVRSLLFFASNELFPGCNSDVSFISNNFKLLKVLDLESVNVGNTLENGIDLPVHLRYLAVGGDMDSLPSSLSKLHDLETLVVKGLMNKFVLPVTVWSMTKLRHIHVTNHCIFTILVDDENGSNSTLDNLVSLSIPFFPLVKETIDILRSFPNIRKLKCIFLEPMIGSMHVCQFPELECLVHLESVKLSYSGRPLKSSVEWNLPWGLKELTLSSFRLPWDQISGIGELPNLEVLKLICRAFEGSKWEMRPEEFLRLKYLKLDSLNIIHWDASCDHLPSLEQLVLRNCKNLVEVPLDFAFISTLQRIEVHQCGISARESVEMIPEENPEILVVVS